MSVETDRAAVEAIRERDQARADLAAAHTREAALRDALLTIHHQGGTHCGHCRRPWPCSTVRALDGTDQQPGDAT